MIDPKVAGQRLQQLRGERSCESVAMAVGVTRQAIWSYEEGLRTPSDPVKCKLADYYGKSVQEIFFD